MRSFGSLFQKGAPTVDHPDGEPRTAQEQLVFGKALKVMAGLYASAHGTSVLQLSNIPTSPDATEYNRTPYEERGWPKLERYAAMIMVHMEAESGAEQQTPKLIDAISMKPIDIPHKEAPKPAEFDAQLAKAHFVGRSDREQVKDLYLSFYLSIGVRERVDEKIRKLRLAADRRVWLLRRNAIGSGFIGALSMLSLFGILFLALPDSSRGFALLAMIPTYGSLVAALLAVQGTDRRVISFTGRVIFVCFAVLACNPLTIFAPATQIHALQNQVGQGLTFAICAGMLASIFHLRPVKALNKMWATARVGSFVAGINFLITFILGQVAGVDLPQQMMHLAIVIIATLFSLTINRRVRAGLQLRLARLGTKYDQDESTETALSNLFGGLHEKDMINKAEDEFRLLPFDRLTDENDLPGDNEPGRSSLQKYSQNAIFGEEHSVFVSHSWRDSRALKWAELSRWAEDFNLNHNALPLLWLDMGCSTPEVDLSLARLPLFTAGCEHFLMLVGETYTLRLWCIMELFCFLIMGNEPGRVICRWCGEGRGVQERSWADIARFDVQYAKCTLLTDERKLLSCIHAGFGQYNAFNEVVRRILAKTITAGADDKLKMVQRRHEAELQILCKSLAESEEANDELRRLIAEAQPSKTDPC